MGDLCTVVDWAAGIFLAGALTMIAFEEQNAARAMLVAAASLTVVRWIMWSLITDSPWWLRGIIGAVIGAVLLTLVPSLWALSIGKSAVAESQQSQVAPTAPVNLQSPADDSHAKQPAQVTGLEVSGHSQGSGNPAMVIDSHGGGSGAEFKAEGQPGQSVIGCRVTQTGPGIGLKVVQTGPGVGLECEATVKAPPKDKTKH